MSRVAGGRFGSLKSGLLVIVALITLLQAMQLPSFKAKVEAFTLVELLAVIFILAVVAALLLPAIGGRPQPAYSARCMSNQKQIAIGFIMWKNDRGMFPWQISSTNGGALEAATRGYAAPNFQTLSHYVDGPNIFVCPTDKTRNRATNFTQCKNQNTSYFVAFGLRTNAEVEILTGDRHLEHDGNPVMPGRFVYSTNMAMNWTHELHGNVKNKNIGILSFADGHAERVFGSDLNVIFLSEGLATNHLAVP